MLNVPGLDDADRNTGAPQRRQQAALLPRSPGSATTSSWQPPSAGCQHQQPRPPKEPALP